MPRCAGRSCRVPSELGSPPAVDDICKALRSLSQVSSLTKQSHSPEAAYLKLCSDPENKQNEKNHLGRVQALKFKEKHRSPHCLFNTHGIGYTQL